MKRKELIGKLLKEGFSEKTLVNFSDNQLKQLASRVLGEEETDEDIMVSKNDPELQKKVADAKQGGKTIETYEELKGKQKNIDKNHNGKIDAEDFAILNKEKKSDIKEIKNIKKCKDCGCTKSECKCKKEDVKEIKNWVKGLVENKEFHSFTSKNEIMELIQTKLTESNTMIQHGPKVKKGHNGIPEFMSYDAIVSAEPATKPKPTTKPGTKPGEKPKTPYQPGPGPNPKPKAMYEEKKSK